MVWNVTLRLVKNKDFLEIISPQESIQFLFVVQGSWDYINNRKDKQTNICREKLHTKHKKSEQNESQEKGIKKCNNFLLKQLHPPCYADITLVNCMLCSIAGYFPMYHVYTYAGSLIGLLLVSILVSLLIVNIRKRRHISLTGKHLDIHLLFFFMHFAATIYCKY